MLTIDIPGLQGNLHISFDQPITKKKASVETSTPPPAKEGPPEDEKLAGYGIQLMNRDALDDEQKTQLAYDLILCLRGKKKSVVRDFLIKHKDHLFSELRDLLIEEYK
jgi:hypothetical protein